jgi:hypothetical protein
LLVIGIDHHRRCWHLRAARMFVPHTRSPLHADNIAIRGIECSTTQHTD